jgi:hypothetical protein
VERQSWYAEGASLYDGKLVTVVHDLFLKLISGSIDADGFLHEVKKRYADLDVGAELHQFIQDEKSASETLTLHKTKVKVDGRKSKLKLQLFFLPAGTAHPPHAHSGLVSLHTIVRGCLELRVFRLISETADAMVIQPCSDRIVGAGDAFETADNMNNIHWFGALEPTIVLDLNVTCCNQKTNLHKAEANSESRIYLDVTGPSASGRIQAMIIGKEQAEAIFSEQLPSSFTVEHPVRTLRILEPQV